MTTVAQDPAGNQGTSAAVAITVSNPAPSITTLNPASVAVGTSVTITGSNFGTVYHWRTQKQKVTRAVVGNRWPYRDALEHFVQRFVQRYGRFQNYQTSARMEVNA